MRQFGLRDIGAPTTLAPGHLERYSNIFSVVLVLREGVVVRLGAFEFSSSRRGGCWGGGGGCGFELW